jgi:hypothetical protein
MICHVGRANRPVLRKLFQILNPQFLRQGDKVTALKIELEYRRHIRPPPSHRSSDSAGAIERIELAEADVDAPDWPEPPIPGTDTIVPIQNLEELESVSQSQQLHLDAPVVQVGESYFYRVLPGQTSTLEITFENGCWGLSKHQGQDGINVQDASIQQEIERWLLTAPESSHDIGRRKARWRRYLRRIEERAEIPAGLSMLRNCTQ